MRHIRVETATHSTRPQLNSRTHSVLDPPDFLSNFKCLYGKYKFVMLKVGLETHSKIKQYVYIYY